MSERSAWAAVSLAGAVLGSAIALGGCSGPAVQTAALSGPALERWCYRTLAEVDCDTTPQPDAELRRVGWFDAVPVE